MPQPPITTTTTSTQHIQSRVQYQPPAPDDNMARLLLRAMQRHAKRTLLVDAATRRQWTGEQLLALSGRAASSLVRQVGVKPNDVVLTICDHTGDEVALAFAIVLAGAALYGSGASDGYEEQKVLCELVRPQVIATCSRLHQQVLQLKRTVDGLRDTRIVWIDDPTKKKSGAGEETDDNNNNNNNNQDSSYYEELIKRDQVYLFDELAAGALDLELLEEIAERRIKPLEHTLTYMLTSGSTGRPKVVPSSHYELMHGIYSMVASTRSPVAGPGQQVNGAGADEAAVDRGRFQLPLDESSVLAGDLPLDHGAGVNTMFLSIYLGSKYIVMPSYQADSFWQAVSDYRISSSIASTTFAYKLFARLKQLIDSGEIKEKGWDLSSFQLIYCAGAKMAYTDLAREVSGHLPNLRIGQCYGCTEIGFMSLPCPSDCAANLNSVGYLCPGLIAKIVEPNSGELLSEPEQRGELRVWANSLFKGYKCSARDDSQAIYEQCHDEEGFYRTGDQAHLDAHGRLYIHGRFKDTLTLMEDWKIMPAELEELVDEHPLVAQSAVIGTPDPELPGCDAPRAFVRLISAHQLTDQLDAELRSRWAARDHQWIADHVYRYVADRTAKPKHLRGGVRILDEFPRVGLLNKIDRKALRLLP